MLKCSKEQFDRIFRDLYKNGYDAFIITCTPKGVESILCELKDIDYINTTYKTISPLRAVIEIRPKWLVSNKPPKNKENFLIWLDYILRKDVYDDETIENIYKILLKFAYLDKNALETVANIAQECAQDKDLKYIIYGFLSEELPPEENTQDDIDCSDYII